MARGPRTGRASWLLLLLAWLTSLVVAPAAAIAADAYRLSLSDKLSIRVVEWQDAENTFANWSALAGDYVVGADGTIAFPFVGPVAAAGATTTELAAALRAGLSQALGLTDPPDVSIEVSAFGPVFVAGAVKSPGAFAFSPGLNVIKAISLAGGTRAGDISADGRDLITLQGTYDVLRQQRVRLLVHGARLDAVLAGSNEIVVPAELELASVAPLVAVETAQLTALSQQVSDRVGSYRRQETLLGRTLEALAQKEIVTQGQLDVARQQLEKVQGLVDNGLAVATRVSSLQTAVADLETRLLDIQAAQLRAQQDLGNTAIQREKVTSDQFLQASEERQQTAAQLDELELKLAMQERLILAVSGAPAVSSDAAAGLDYDYVILRGGSQIAATQTDAVLPGDVISVALRPAE